ncbi:hypothetical protein ACF0H5_002684 [Mactra antiquata]
MASVQFRNYEIYIGRTISSGVVFYTGIDSPLRCLSVVAEMTPNNESTLALYNQLTNNCEKYPVNQTTFLLAVGGTSSVVYWDTSACNSITSSLSTYYEYVDWDLYGYDLIITTVSSRLECAHLCESNYGNNSKGFLYQYSGTGSNRCICKWISVEDFIKEGHSLVYAGGFSYYDRLCND